MHVGKSSFHFSRSSRGFTIVELLIVIVVIGILAAITIVAYSGIQQRAKISAADSAATQASKKILSYAITNGEQLPVDLATAGLVNDATTTYQYTRNTGVTPNLYCVTATANGVSSHVASNGPTVDGPCPGHTGVAPSSLADGSACPIGYILVPGSSLYNTQAFCVMKYEAKNVSGVATSQASGTPWVSISQTTAISTAAAACAGCHLIAENEWLTIAQNVMTVDSNWSGGTVGSGFMYSGHNDNVPANSLAAGADSDPYNGTGQTTGSTQRRTLTLTNGEVIWDLSGNVLEWTTGTIAAGLQPGLLGEVSFVSKQYNNTSLLQNGLASSAYPVYALSAASGWNSTTQNIGQLYSNISDSSLRGFLRGGEWSTGVAGAGVYRLTLNLGQSSTSSTVGFRVAR